VYVIILSGYWKVHSWSATFSGNKLLSCLQNLQLNIALS